MNSENLFQNNTVMEIASYYQLKDNVSDYLSVSDRERCCVAVFSVKHFLHLNEIHGKSAITKLNKFIDSYMQKVLNQNEAFANITNNRFVIFLKGDDFEKRLEHYLDDISREMALDKLHMKISFICGVYKLKDNDNGDGFIGIIDKATSAMLSADKFSGNTDIIFYSEDVFKAISRRQEIESELTNAVPQKQLVVEIQPKFDLKTGDCVSAEALVRWNHPTLGRLTPDEFIPIAEHTGAVIDIDMYVLETICKYMRIWVDSGINPVPIAVNQSRLHISDPNYLDSVFNMLMNYDVWPNLIELETTESIAFYDYDAVTEILKELHNFGFVLSMDDFGSGYASLHMLNELEYDVLKLDQKIIQYGKNPERSNIILRHIIEIAHELNMIVVAEGVETEQQAELLKNLNCDIAQGFLYARPMPIDKFEASVFGRVTPMDIV